ncbi:photosystem II reaction center protein PsbX [Prochlorococcus sp. MIT 1300]|uniref:photosystem II reaction center protein PsbX n=1 Tax=Prochlorococcus sp. MIT 1300 TaxID=3096218 RepID=UPI002A756DC4|nr:photosystem II reaction center protein PsbX [Prochlorococcus sp. MIT 1300]
MSLSFLSLLLGSGVSLEASRLSAESMVGSFIAAALLIIVPAASFLIWVSNKDQLTRSR